MYKKLQNKKILLVDDNDTNRLLILLFLEEFKMNITEVLNGYDAIEILKKENFDLIITDINMPIINGYDLIKSCQNELKIKTPIIIVSAEDETEINKIIKNIDSLRMPFSIKNLIKIIEKNI